MKEIKLHKWWAKNYSQSYFKCNDDKIIKILNPGKYNLHDGPDYIGTVIETNGIKLIGNTEIHIFEQDYKRHNHLMIHILMLYFIFLFSLHLILYCVYL